jgi:ParB/RepB/Spo0J family partition protein
MPKMESGGRLRQISLSQIVDAGNIRQDYQDIEELADSIKTVGQIEPIAVKSLGKNADGIEEYELWAGFRRKRAFELLCERGENFTMIDAVVVAGDKLTMQLVENLQRSDLTAKERERGIYLMAESGLKNKDIASRLSKSEQFVGRNITACKIREVLEKAAQAEIDSLTKMVEAVNVPGNDDAIKRQAEEGLATAQKRLQEIDGLSTQALNEIQAAEQKDLFSICRDLIAFGGTVSAARKLMEAYKGGKQEPEFEGMEPAASAETTSTEAVVIKAPGSLEVNSADDVGAILGAAPRSIEDILDPLDGEAGDIAPESGEPGIGTGAYPSPRAEPKREKPAARKLAPFDPPHKTVDANNVQVVIKEYIDLIGKTEAGSAYQNKIDAAYDIWALLLKRL